MSATKGSILLDAYDGVVPETEEDLKSAKKADLVTLPKDVPGTNCGNCKFVKTVGKEEGVTIGMCMNPALVQPVSERMCCALWDHAKALRSWEK